MIENQNHKNSDDEVIRRLMQSTQIKASDNLKFRIMHQIEIEAALSKKQESVKINQQHPLKSFWSIFGVMYAIIALILGFAYFTKGSAYLLSKEIIGAVAFVSFVFACYWLMTKVEELYRRKATGNMKKREQN